MKYFLTVKLFILLKMFFLIIYVSPVKADNNLYLHGTLTSNACDIHPDDANIVVDMRNIVRKYFKLYDKSQKFPFEIRLINCDTSVLKSADIIFIGMMNNQDIRYFGIVPSITGQVSDSLVLSIETDKGVELHNGIVSEKFDLSENDMKLKFNAYLLLIKNTSIELGPFSTATNFLISYY